MVPLFSPVEQAAPVQWYHVAFRLPVQAGAAALPFSFRYGEQTSATG